MYNLNDAFKILANSNRFADARNTDKTLRTYIGKWKSGTLSKYKMTAMLKKWGFKEITEPMYALPNPLKEDDEQCNETVRS